MSYQIRTGDGLFHRQATLTNSSISTILFVDLKRIERLSSGSKPDVIYPLYYRSVLIDQEAGKITYSTLYSVIFASRRMTYCQCQWSKANPISSQCGGRETRTHTSVLPDERFSKPLQYLLCLYLR